MPNNDNERSAPLIFYVREYVALLIAAAEIDVAVLDEVKVTCLANVNRPRLAEELEAFIDEAVRIGRG